MLEAQALLTSFMKRERKYAADLIVLESKEAFWRGGGLESGLSKAIGSMRENAFELDFLAHSSHL